MSRKTRRHQGGFSTVEAVLIMTLIAMATLTMAHTVISGQRALGHIEEDARIMDQAQILMTRLTQIPFGTGTESAAPASDISMVVAVENNLFGSSTASSGANGSTVNGYSPTITQNFTGANVTLTQMALTSPLNWQYAVNGNSFYGLGKTWRVLVDRDLNGDGDTTDPMELATATSQDLFRVEIQYDGKRVLHTVRSRNPTE